MRVSGVGNVSSLHLSSATSPTVPPAFTVAVNLPVRLLFPIDAHCGFIYPRGFCQTKTFSRKLGNLYLRANSAGVYNLLYHELLTLIGPDILTFAIFISSVCSLKSSTNFFIYLSSNIVADFTLKRFGFLSIRLATRHSMWLHVSVPTHFVVTFLLRTVCLVRMTRYNNAVPIIFSPSAPNF